MNDGINKIKNNPKSSQDFYDTFLRADNLQPKAEKYNHGALQH